MENKRKHLEMIQSVINRMAGNLFFLKGWTITLITGLFALTAKDFNKSYVPIAYCLLIIFWILDGYFLSQERLFRSLYDDARKLEEKDIDFSMDTSKYKSDWQNTWPCAIFSPTLLWFYLPLAAAMLLTIYLLGK
jgi:hypothetical protein